MTSLYFYYRKVKKKKIFQSALKHWRLDRAPPHGQDNGLDHELAKS